MYIYVCTMYWNLEYNNEVKNYIKSSVYYKFYVHFNLLKIKTINVNEQSN